MGEVKALVDVSDGNGGPKQRVTVLADTGATYSMLPESVLSGIGVQPYATETFILADESEIQLPVGRVFFEAEGRGQYVPVVFGKRSLLGSSGLQALGLIPDTTHHRLVPARLYL